MARPIKIGLDYFSHDVDASFDEKIQHLEALYGNDGYAFYFKLLERIYRNGGSLRVSDGVSEAETIQVLCRKLLNLGDNGTETFRKILQTCLKLGLFDEKEYTENGVLTSSGIQKRCSSINKKRVKSRTVVVSASETHPETPESKVKKSKVKKSKVISSDKKNEEPRHRRGADPKAMFFLATDSEWATKIQERGLEWVNYWVREFNRWAQKNIQASAKIPSHFLEVQSWEQRRIEEGKEWCANYPTGPGYYPTKAVQDFLLQLAGGAQ